MVKEDTKIKSVSFDISIPLQSRLWKIAIEQKNFSDYVRTLMIADLLADGALSDLSIVNPSKDNLKKPYDPKDFTIDI